MFRPSEIACFRFTGRSYEPSTGLARLGYALDERYEFFEEYQFPKAPAELSSAQSGLIERLLFHLHLAAGVSYFKAAVPPRIEVEQGALSPLAARFFEKLYRKGLGEFAYKNQIPLSDRISFSGSEAGVMSPLSLPRAQPKFLVPLGGGKDSLVTVEILRKYRLPMAGFILGDFPVIKRVADAAQLEVLQVRRQLDQQLFELNRQGAYNGHVPISAIFAFTSLIAAVLHGYSAVVGSQERSAESGNVFYDGIEVNHQYSKSLEFERDLKELLASEISSGVVFFSLLRPLSEVHIAKLFAGMTRYHAVFASCNRSFRLNGPQSGLWCGDCAKCRFVFLALAPFLPRRALIGIFGKDLLDDEAQIPGFLDILGFGAMKPFECVGEFEEAQWCLETLLSAPEWENSATVRKLAEPITLRSTTASGVRYRKAKGDLFLPSSEHELPPEMERLLYEFARA